MADIISLQELADAKLDAQSLERFINGGVDEEVLTRLSQQYPTIKKLLLEFQKYNGRAYKTYAEMDADKANLSSKTKVTVTNDAIDSNNGDWQWDGAVFTKSAFDPLTQGMAYTADYVSKTGFAKIAGNVQTNINYDTATRTLTFSNTVHIVTGTSRVQLTTPQSVVFDQNAMYRLEFNVSTGLIRAQVYTQNYIEGWIPFAFVRAYFDKIETSDFQYAVNGVASDQISRSGYGVISASRSASINFNSTTENLEFEDEVIISTETTTYTLNTPVTVNFPTFGYFRLEYNVMTGAVRVQPHYQDRTENWVVLGLIRYSRGDGMIWTKDFFYTVDDVLYIPEQFAIKSSSINAEEKDRALKRELITANSNLYDANSAKIGYRVDLEGVEVADATYCVSDYIDVSPLQDITIKAEQNNGAPYRGFNSISYYDLNKNFVKREGVDNTGNGSVDGAIVVTMPLDIYYIRLNMLSTSPDGYKRQINYGSTALTYEPHSKTLNPSINVDFNELWSVGTNSIENRAITPEKTDFIEVSKNLFDKSQVILGKSINSSGVIVDNAPTALSSYIRVKPSTNYTAAIFPESAVNTINTLTEFNSSGQLIKQSTFYGQAKPSFTTTSNTAQIVFSMTNNSANLGRMLVEGSSVDAYEEFGVKRLVGIEVDTATSITPFGEYDRKMTDLPVDDVFTTDETYSEFAGFYDSEPSDVYALWDTLMSEHPTYITRKFMGQDAFGYDMYVYHLKPKTLDSPYRLVEKRPKIGVTCAMHGFEKAGTLTMYLLARDMCKNWRTNKLLEALRFNVEFVVMPIMNPSGYVDKTYKNRNGVDLNNNFPYKFDEQVPRDQNDPYYHGTHALSEPETQHVVQMLDDHPDFDAFIDFHSFGGVSVELHPYVTYTSTSGGKIIPHMTQMLSGRLARILQKKYEFFPQDEDYQASRITNHGDNACMMKNYIHFERKIEQTATFEVGANIWHEPVPRMFSDVQKNCAVHSFYNWVLLNVNEICRR